MPSSLRRLPQPAHGIANRVPHGVATVHGRTDGKGACVSGPGDRVLQSGAGRRGEVQGILPSYSLPRVVWSVLDVSAYTGAERGPHEQPDPKSILFAYHDTYFFSH